VPRKRLLAYLSALLVLPALGAAAPTASAAAAPDPPTGLRNAGATGTSVSLVWQPPVGGTKPASYQILRDGAVTGTATIPSAMSVGLKPATTYRYTVRALDKAGTASRDSAPLSVTTGSDPGGGGGPVAWAGARSSSYGISPFPDPCGWTAAMTTMGSYFPGSTPSAVWIVGHLSGNGVQLEFPKPAGGRTYPNVSFAGSDKHESYLKYFDTHGIKVWLQVESGFADMPTLIDLVLNRYGSHPSVVGFGVDVEWFNPRGADLNDPVTDQLAQAWETKVNGYNPKYTLFLKHFDQSSMPPNYRGGIVFVDDSQEFPSGTAFIAEMKAWADRYYPNPVMYQLGYATDKAWWSQEAKPVPRSLAAKLQAVTRQSWGIAWVDFTLRDVVTTTC
jgi:Fibronectin type III domain